MENAQSPADGATTSKASVAVFALMLVALGIAGFIHADYAGVWQPLPDGVRIRAAIACLCAVMSVACGLGLFWLRTAVLASRGFFAWMVLWLVAFRFRAFIEAPTTQDSWSGIGETLVVLAAAWLLFVQFAPQLEQMRWPLLAGTPAVRTARFLFGVALVIFGIAHFTHLRDTASAVPSWLPFHRAWAIATGCAFVLAGLALAINRYARLAAWLATAQMALFLVLVWVPILAAGHHGDDEVSETIITAALAISGWVVADSWRVIRPSPSIRR